MEMILLALILWPLAEIAAAFAVAHAIGVLPCVLLLIAGWPVGSAVLRFEGRATIRRLREALSAGQAPDGGAALGLLAGPLLIVPGFVTDAVAALLLVPTVRRWLWTRLLHRARNRMRPRGGGFGPGARRSYDVDGTARETPRGDRVLPQTHG